MDGSENGGDDYKGFVKSIANSVQKFAEMLQQNTIASLSEQFIEINQEFEMARPELNKIGAQLAASETVKNTELS